jgi:HAD superfamily hydrolase (TIGR01509 family)
MLKALLFDVDGTLAETEEFHRCAFNSAFADLGLDVQWSVTEYRELLKVTGGKERLAAYFGARGQVLAEERIRTIHEAKNARYARDLEAGRARLRPGVLRLMDEAEAAGIRLGIATTTSPVNLESLLGPLLGEHWKRRFACVVAGDAVARKKPAPDVYQACLAQLGVAPTEAVAVEDSLPGLAAAHAAGIRVILTPSLYTEGEDYAAAEYLLPDLGEPASPWDRAIRGFARRWVQIADLQVIADASAMEGRAAGTAAANSEVAQ